MSIKHFVSMALAMILTIPTMTAQVLAPQQQMRHNAMLSQVKLTPSSSNTLSLPGVDVNQCRPEAKMQFGKQNLPVSPMKAASGVKAMQGLMLGTDSWSIGDAENRQPGVYEIPATGSAPESFAVVKDLSDLPWTFFGSFGTVYTPDEFYVKVANYVNGQFKSEFHYIYDTNSWELKKQWEDNNTSIWINGSAYDPTSGLVYCHFTKADEHYAAFGTYDIETGDYNFITTTDNVNDIIYNCYSIAFDSKGQLYSLAAARTDSGWGTLSLYKIDKTTGGVTLVGDTGMGYSAIGANMSIAIDPSDTYMYLVYQGSYNSTGGKLCTVSLADATVAQVYTLPDNEGFKHIWFPVDPAPELPAAVAEVATSFTDDSLSGTVSFTMPSKSIGGDNLSGDLSYEVTFNGVLKASGTAAAGSVQNVTVNAGASGMYTVSVRIKNANGYSPITSTKTYVGRDIPSVLTNVKAVYNATTNAIDVTWDTPAPANGGYFQPEKLKYTVVLYPMVNDVNVKDNVTGNATSFPLSITSTDPVDFYVRVTAIYDNVSYNPVSSPRVAYGYITAPYSNDFSANANGFTFINANNDTHAWQFSSLWKWCTLNSNPNDYSDGSDDYLILPATVLEAGKAYRYNFEMASRISDCIEEFEILAGTDTTVTALNKVLLPRTKVLDTTHGCYQHVYFSPETSGKYYVAIHAISPRMNGTLYLYNVEICEGISAELAEEMTDFTVSRSEDGTLKAILEFTASAKELSGKALSSLDRVEVMRNDSIIETLHPTPGQKVRWEDTSVPENNTYTYTITPYTDKGKGISTSRSAFIGVRLPSDTKSISVRYGVDTGHFNIEWDSDATDVAGDPFDEETLTYNLYKNTFAGGLELIAGGLKTKKRSYRACKPDAEQEFIYFGVAPQNNVGEGYGMQSEAMPMGKPEPTPYRDSFANKRNHKLYTVENHAYYYADFIFSSDTDFKDIRSVDGDNGFLVFGANESSRRAKYVGGLISLDGVEKPVFTYYYYCWEYSNTADLYINAGNEWVCVDSFTSATGYNTLVGERWIRRTVDLSAYKDKNIRWKLDCCTVDGMYSLFDNFYIGEDHGKDLAVSKISAPGRVQAGKEFTVQTNVLNFGSKASGAFVANLYIDGELADSSDETSIPVGSAKIVSFSNIISIADEPSHTYKIEIMLDGDEDDSNNATEVVTVERSSTFYPVPVDVEGKADGASAVISWTAPDFTERNIPVTDGAEDYTDFSTGLTSSVVEDDFVGEWTMVDGDDTYNYTISATSYPNMQNKSAFMVFNPVAAGCDLDMNAMFTPASGDKYFVSFLPLPYRETYDDPWTLVPMDDWMISPMLSGKAQTVTCKVKSSAEWFVKEQYQIYYSTADTASVDAMVLLQDTTEAAYDWEEISFDLPEGATYFAIRSVGEDGFLFMVDDVTFCPASAFGKGLTLKGYKVYRDGRLISGDEPVNALTFTDPDAAGFVRTYQVTAVYDRGESIPVNVTVDLSGLDAVATANVAVSSGRGCLKVAATEGAYITVAAADGRVMDTTVARAANTTINIAPGVYLVTVDSKTFKVIVK